MNRERRIEHSMKATHVTHTSRLHTPTTRRAGGVMLHQRRRADNTKSQDMHTRFAILAHEIGVPAQTDAAHAFSLTIIPLSVYEESRTHHGLANITSIITIPPA